VSSPQKENGFTPIANEILDEIMKFKLNGTQFRLVLAIWRYTYGFNRSEWGISETFLSKALGVSVPNISRDLKSLFAMNILKKTSMATFSKSAVIKFNKDYDTWQLLAKTITVIESDNTTVIESDNQERKYKENKEKNKHLSFFEEIWKLYPLKKGKAAVSMKAKAEISKAGFDTISKSIKTYIDQKPEWQNYMNGSTFFNGRWLEFLETAEQTTENVIRKNRPDGWEV
jgi:phage replication O-like protein O